MQGDAAADSPDAAGERSGDLAYAALVLLERLTPEERAIFLLRDVFDADYAVAAEALSKSEASCRQLLHRARERLAEGRPRHQSTPHERLELLRRLHAATQALDGDALTRLIAPSATYTTDGGGKVSASARVLEGVARVVRLVLGVARKSLDGEQAIVFIDGEPALVAHRLGRPHALTFIEADETGIVALYKVMNPDKLRGVPSLHPG